MKLTHTQKKKEKKKRRNIYTPNFSRTITLEIIFDAKRIKIKGDVTISCEIVALWDFFF
jgi:HSP20 family molecular chaperone IbpA